MASSKISQREARRLKRRVREFENMERHRRNVWCADYPGGHHVLSRIDTSDAKIIELCRKLGHAVVVTTNGSNEIRYYALKNRELP